MCTSHVSALVYLSRRRLRVHVPKQAQVHWLPLSGKPPRYGNRPLLLIFVRKKTRANKFGTIFELDFFELLFDFGSLAIILGPNSTVLLQRSNNSLLSNHHHCLSRVRPSLHRQKNLPDLIQSIFYILTILQFPGGECARYRSVKLLVVLA